MYELLLRCDFASACCHGQLATHFIISLMTPVVVSSLEEVRSFVFAKLQPSLGVGSLSVSSGKSLGSSGSVIEDISTS